MKKLIKKIHNKISARFTRWYIKRGYTFWYDFENCSIYSDGIFNTPLGTPNAVFNCPWWVKPLLIFFSPSVYTIDKVGKTVIAGILDGLLLGEESTDE